MKRFITIFLVILLVLLAYILRGFFPLSVKKLIYLKDASVLYTTINKFDNPEILDENIYSWGVFPTQYTMVAVISVDTSVENLLAKINSLYVWKQALADNNEFLVPINEGGLSADLYSSVLVGLPDTTKDTPRTWKSRTSIGSDKFLKMYVVDTAGIPSLGNRHNIIVITLSPLSVF